MKNGVLIFLLSCFLCTISCAGVQDSRLPDLINQLNGKTCKYEIENRSCVKSKPLNFLLRRNNKERCIMDAATALGMMGDRARPAVPALIDALKKYHNVDSGDGFITVRSEIALALGKIGDTSAIKPLSDILASNDPAVLSESASVRSDYKLTERTSHAAVAEALGMFGSLSKEGVKYIIPLLKYPSGSDYAGGKYYIQCAQKSAAKALGQIKSKEAFPALIDALDDRNCRIDSLNALGSFGADAKEIVPVLNKWLEKNRQSLKQYELSVAEEVIKKLANKQI